MTKRLCSTCLYDADGYDTYGTKKCKHIIGVCSSLNDLQGWKPINDDDGFDPDRYTPHPTVMSDEKEYMDIRGVI